MTYIWSTIIVLSIIFTLLTGSVIDLNNVILTTSFDTLKSFGIIASNIILWSGILEVCVDSGMMKYIAYLIKPLIKPLFKTKSEEVLDLISAGFACNIFSLGSAAAPFAIKAMKLLDEENPKKGRESKDMTTLVIINACGFTLLPTSLMALRANFDAKINDIVIMYIIIISFATTMIMIIINKVVSKWF